MNQAELIQSLAARIEVLEAAVASLSAPRDRGPKSQSEMTEEHAFRCKFGDLKDTKHKEVAELLGLSYGQVFSCRGGYTFKQVKADWKPKAGVQPAVQPEAQQEAPAA